MYWLTRRRLAARDNHTYEIQRVRFELCRLQAVEENLRQKRHDIERQMRLDNPPQHVARSPIGLAFWDLVVRDGEIDVAAFPEEAPIRGNYIVSNDPEYDEEMALAIEEDLAAGNEWMWCAAAVRVQVVCPYTDEEIVGVDTMTCCSHTGEAEFVRGTYYEDMVREARLDCWRNLVAAYEAGQIGPAAAGIAFFDPD